MAKKRLKKNVKKGLIVSIIIIAIIILTIVGVIATNYYLTYSEKLTPIDQKKDYYNISDFGYERLKSDKDYNNNGKDDYTDFLEAEKKFSSFNPKYVMEYYDNGYPPIEKECISADLTWYALKNAGYNLRDLIDKDIRLPKKKSTYYIDIPDSNIDFRRIYNQEIFFTRYIEVLNIDPYDIGNFMPGDILTFGDSDHLAMVSDKYNENGVPYIIHQNEGSQKEEDCLEKEDMKLTGHYRFKYNNKIQELINMKE